MWKSERLASQAEWTRDDEEAYERIKRSELRLGKSDELAEESAVRTVNLQRRARTQSRP